MAYKNRELKTALQHRSNQNHRSNSLPFVLHYSANFIVYHELQKLRAKVRSTHSIKPELPAH